MQEKLKQFREAAQHDYVDICDDLLQEMFLELDVKALLLYGIKKAREYLPIFESRYPELSWTHEFITLLEKLEAFNYRTPAFNYFTETEQGEIVQRYDVPGVWSFLDGLDLLKQALEYYLKNQIKLSLELSGGAVSQFVGAVVVDHWGQLYPEEYAAYGEGILTEPDRPDHRQRWDAAVKIYSENVERRELHLKLFLELADDLEAIINKGRR
ncbi:MAG: hypothetical protein GXY36_12385 [Chloroflexi bacterium]|nr:hypothetical protein [Chloroflexota bacterium]